MWFLDLHTSQPFYYFSSI